MPNTNSLSRNPFINSIRESTGIRLCLLFGSFFIMLLISSFVSILLNNTFSWESERTKILINSLLQCIFAFCIPTYILARFCSKKPIKWLCLTQPPTIKALTGVVIVYILSMPAMEWLIEWNNNIHLHDSLQTIENVLRNWEDQNSNTTKILLDTHGFLPVLAGILVIGLITGFSEELFFRGGLQNILTQSKLSIAISVWTTAFIFSSMHFQFFGFIPRLIMGAFFGYLLIWTKSIWVPVFAHVLNNSMVVISAAISDFNSFNLMSSSEIPDKNFSLVVLGSFVLTSIFLIIFRNRIFKTKINNQPWQKRRRHQVIEKY